MTNIRYDGTRMPISFPTTLEFVLSRGGGRGGCHNGGQMLWLGILNPSFTPTQPTLQAIHQNPIFPVLWLSIFLSFYNKAWDSKHIQCLGGRPLHSNMLDLWALYEPDCFSQNSTSISSIFTLAKYSGRRRRFKYLWQILLKFTPVHSKLNQTVGS